MRVKEAGDNTVTTSKDVPPGGALYPSDESVEYSIYEYNSTTGQTE
jgi:hypothetical protein